MENSNMTGHWIGVFTERGDETEIDFTECVKAKKWFMKPFVKSYLRKQQAQFVAGYKKGIGKDVDYERYDWVQWMDAKHVCIHSDPVHDDLVLREKTAKLWAGLNNAPILPEHINCEGCRKHGAKTIFCEHLLYIGKVEKCMKN